MKDDWNSYFCNVNGKLASIFLNLALQAAAPDSSRKWLLWVWVYFRNPRPDGLSDSGEAPVLFTIEDALTSRICRHCDGLLAGRITTEGRREFYFYGRHPNGFREAVGEELSRFPGYSHDADTKEDPAWEQYLTVLCPSSDDLQRMKNRDVLDMLLKQGDVPTRPRPVQHWLYFPSDAARDLFKKEATEKLGFQLISEDMGERPLKFGITISRVESVEQKVIDSTVIQLFHLAQSVDGEYDGWETAVMKS